MFHRFTATISSRSTAGPSHIPLDGKTRKNYCLRTNYVPARQNTNFGAQVIYIPLYRAQTQKQSTATTTRRQQETRKKLTSQGWCPLRGAWQPPVNGMRFFQIPAPPRYESALAQTDRRYHPPPISGRPSGTTGRQVRRTDMHACMHEGRQAGRQTGRQAGGRQAGRQAGRRAGRQGFRFRKG